MYKVIKLEQNTNEWKDYRRKKIGASDAPIILGVSPYKTAYKLWEEKIYSLDQFETDAMKRGKTLEVLARDCFMNYTKSLIKPQVVESLEHEWMMASLDGIDIDNEFIVEIKCPNKDDHELAKNGEIPKKYMPQVQHQLAVTGLKYGYYFSFDGENGVVVKFERDSDMIAILLEKEKEFYFNHLLTEVPPDNGIEYIIDDDFDRFAEHYVFLDDKIKELQEMKEKTKEEIVRLSNNRNVKNDFICVKKVNKKGIIDYKRLCLENHINEEAYRKSGSSYWKIDTI